MWISTTSHSLFLGVNAAFLYNRHPEFGESALDGV